MNRYQKSVAGGPKKGLAATPEDQTQTADLKKPALKGIHGSSPQRGLSPGRFVAVAWRQGKGRAEAAGRKGFTDPLGGQRTVHFKLTDRKGP